MMNVQQTTTNNVNKLQQQKLQQTSELLAIAMIGFYVPHIRQTNTPLKLHYTIYN